MILNINTIYEKNGFTLIETLMVIIVFAIGVAIAIPNIMEMGKNNEFKSEARSAKDLLAKAKMLAIENNAQRVVLFDKNGHEFLAFNDTDGDNAYADGVDSLIELHRVKSSIDASDLFANADGNFYIIWGTKGLPGFGVGQKTVDISRGAQKLSIEISMNGNVRISK